MTAIARRVRVKAGRDRHRDTAARFPMTSSATDAAHIQVPRMIELHPETLQVRKRFQRAGLNIGMTDSADRTFGI